MNDNLNIEVLESFLKKMEMYIYPISQDSIQSFVTGFEVGAQSSVLTKEISSYLEEEYGIKKPAMGYPYQIEVYAKNNEISWVDAFIEITNTVITRISTNDKIDE